MTTRTDRNPGLGTRRVGFLLFLFLLAFCLVMILPSRSDDGDRASSQAGVTGGAEAPAPAASADLLPTSTGTREARSRLAPLSFRDWLTGDPLDLPDIRIEAGDELLYSLRRDGPRPEQAITGARGDWVYTIRTAPDEPPGTPFRTPVREALPDERGRVFLPYCTGIRGVVTAAPSGAPLDGARVSGWLFHPDRLDELRQEHEEDVWTPAVLLDNLLFLARVYEDRYGSAPMVETETDEEGGYRLLLPAAHPIRLHVWHGRYGSRTAVIDPRPGEWLTWPVALDPAPVLRGVVRGPDGTPLPRVEVKLAAVFDGPGYSLSPYENTLRGMATLFATHNQAWAINLKTTAVTGADGTYRVPMPRAPHYSASAAVDSSYAFASTSHPVPAADGTITLDLHLEDPDPEVASLTRKRFRFASGRPVADAEVIFTVVSDYLWQRQFPHLRTDQDGQVDLPWQEPGIRYGIVLKGPTLARPFFSFTFLEVQEITVPDEYFKEDK